MDRIEQAFAKFERANFLPGPVRGLAGADMPLSIGHGQTNSQPTTVKMMLKWLDVKPSDKVLDVGSGSGWTTALLSYLTGTEGKVYAVEIVPSLVEFGQQNVKRAGVYNAELHLAGDVFGLPEKAPFDRILVSASADKLPQELIGQLKPGGKMVIPVRNSVWEVIKKDENNVEITQHPGFAFVPLL